MEIDCQIQIKENEIVLFYPLTGSATPMWYARDTEELIRGVKKFWETRERKDGYSNQKIEIQTNGRIVIYWNTQNGRAFCSYRYKIVQLP